MDLEMKKVRWEGKSKSAWDDEKRRDEEEQRREEGNELLSSLLGSDGLSHNLDLEKSEKARKERN